MAEFKQAVEWLKEGKWVTRPVWQKDSYWKLGKDKVICWKDGTNAHIHLNQFLALDWEIYEIREQEELKEIQKEIEGK